MTDDQISLSKNFLGSSSDEESEIFSAPYIPKSKLVKSMPCLENSQKSCYKYSYSSENRFLKLKVKNVQMSEGFSSLFNSNLYLMNLLKIHNKTSENLPISKDEVSLHIQRKKNESSSPKSPGILLPNTSPCSPHSPLREQSRCTHSPNSNENSPSDRSKNNFLRKSSSSSSTDHPPFLRKPCPFDDPYKDRRCSYTLWNKPCIYPNCNKRHLKPKDDAICCKYFANGYCHKSNFCPFLHSSVKYDSSGESSTLSDQSCTINVTSLDEVNTPNDKIKKGSGSLDSQNALLSSTKSKEAPTYSRCSNDALENEIKEESQKTNSSKIISINTSKETVLDDDTKELQSESQAYTGQMDNLALLDEIESSSLRGKIDLMPGLSPKIHQESISKREVCSQSPINSSSNGHRIDNQADVSSECNKAHHDLSSKRESSASPSSTLSDASRNSSDDERPKYTGVGDVLNFLFKKKQKLDDDMLISNHSIATSPKTNNDKESQETPKNISKNTTSKGNKILDERNHNENVSMEHLKIKAINLETSSSTELLKDDTPLIKNRITSKDSHNSRTERKTLNSHLTLLEPKDMKRRLSKDSSSLKEEYHPQPTHNSPKGSESIKSFKIPKKSKTSILSDALVSSLASPKSFEEMLALSPLPCQQKIKKSSKSFSSQAAKENPKRALKEKSKSDEKSKTLKESIIDSLTDSRSGDDSKVKESSSKIAHSENKEREKKSRHEYKGNTSDTNNHKEKKQSRKDHKKNKKTKKDISDKSHKESRKNNLEEISHRAIKSKKSSTELIGIQRSPSESISTESNEEPKRKPSVEPLRDHRRPSMESIGDHIRSESIEDQRKVSSKSIRDQIKPFNESTGDQRRPSSESIGGQRRSSSESIGGQRRSSSESIGGQRKPSSKSISSQRRPSSRSIRDQRKTSSESIEDKRRPSSQPIENHRRPSTDLIGNQRKSFTESIEDQEKTCTNLPEHQEKPLTKSISHQRRPSTKSFKEKGFTVSSMKAAHKRKLESETISEREKKYIKVKLKHSQENIPNDLPSSTSIATCMPEPNFEGFKSIDQIKTEETKSDGNLTQFVDISCRIKSEPQDNFCPKPAKTEPIEMKYNIKEEKPAMHELEKEHERRVLVKNSCVFLNQHGIQFDDTNIYENFHRLCESYSVQELKLTSIDNPDLIIWKENMLRFMARKLFNDFGRDDVPNELFMDFPSRPLLEFVKHLQRIREYLSS